MFSTLDSGLEHSIQPIHWTLVAIEEVHTVVMGRSSNKNKKYDKTMVTIPQFCHNVHWCWRNTPNLML